MLFIYFTGYVEMEEFELLCWNKSVGLNVIDCFSFLHVNISTNKNKGLGITPWTKILSALTLGDCFGLSGIPSDSEKHLKDHGLPQSLPPPHPPQLKEKLNAV